MTVKYALAAAVALAFSSTAMAADKGVNEVSGSMTYADIEDVSIFFLNGSYGRYITPMHEVGVNATYANIDSDIDELGGSLDGIMVGPFYQLNFDHGGNLVPFIGASVNLIEGDLGDSFDYSYGVSAGLKLYPYANTGVVVSVGYQNLVASEDWYDDIDAVTFNVGLAVRF